MVGHCYEEGSLSLPYLAFVEAMRSYVLLREPDGLKSDLGTGAADVARIVSEVRDRVGVELRPAGDPEDDRYRLLQAVSGFLRNASTVQPILIVLEDLHWADRGTLDLLLHVARNLQGARLLVVGTYRDVEVDRAHPLSNALGELRRGSTFSRVPLRGLTQDEVLRMISSLTTQEPQWSLAEAVFRQTEGNPLFIQEVVRYIAEEGLVERADGRWQRTAGNEQLTERIPEGLRDVIGKRLSRLSAETNALLTMASVIGRDFDLETLRRIAGQPEELLLTSIEEAMKIGVLEERPRPGAVSYRFPHAFFRQTLYEEMIAPRRLQLHQTVARALEEQYAARREEHAAELAEHFAQSTDRSDLAKAVGYGELAARRAMAVFAYSEAAGHLERCLAVKEVFDSGDKAKRCDLLLALGDALIPQGAVRRLEEVAEEAFSVADALGDGLRAARAVHLARRGLETRYGAVPASLTEAGLLWQQRAGRYAAQGSREDLQASLGAAAQLAARGRFSERWTVLQQALVRVRLDGEMTGLFEVAMAVLAVVNCPSLQLTAARDLAEEVVTWPRTGLMPYYAAFGPTGWPGLIALIWANRGKCEALWQELALLAGQVHDRQAEATVQMTEIALATLDGRLQDAIRITDTLREQGDEAMPGFALLGDVQSASRAKLLLGNPDGVMVSLAAFLGGAGSNVRADPTPTLHRAKWTLALAHKGLLDDARADLDRLMAAGRAIGPLDELPLHVLTDLLEAAVLVEEKEAAVALVATLEPYSLLISGHSPTVVARHLGAASVLLGKPDQGRGYYDQALEVCAKVRFRPEIALTRLSLAELLLEHYPDEHHTAIEHLDFAIAEFGEMKMQPSLERALRHRGLLKA